MRKLLAGLVLLLVPIAFAVSQDNPEWYVNKPISDIVFKGLNSVSENDLSGIIEPYVGKTFTDSLFWDLQSQLYALDYFEQIIPNALPANDERSAVIIQFDVVERPSIDSIEFRGNSHFRRSELLDVILLKRGDMVTKSKLQLDESAIRNHYIEKGFPDVKVSGSTEDIPDAKRTKVIFTIEEGYQTSISEIRFSGNSFASASTLKGVIKSKEQSLFSSGIYQESTVVQDKDQIRQYYTKRGFVDAQVTDVKVDSQPNEADGKNSLILTFYIDEGEQYVFGGISFEGNTIFSDEQLQDKVSMKDGKVLDLPKLESDFLQVADLYYENGYIFNGFERVEHRDEAAKSISYTLNITEQSRAHIENIIFKGNEKTKDYVLRREIPLEVGDIFSKKKISEGLRNLMNLQYFSAINPEPVYGSTEGLMDLIVNVEETNTADIRFGVSFGSVDFPVSAYVKLADRNFLGRGQTLGAELNLSPVQQSITFNFLDNWLADRRWSGGVDLSIVHKTTSGIRQDILSPIFSGDEKYAVPDPYDGHYVFSEDKTYDTVDYKAGDDFPGVPSQSQIDDLKLITDYKYALSTGKDIPPQYLMSYNSWELGLGLNTGYVFKLPFGDVNVGTGFRTSLSRLEYDPTVNRPFSPEDRDNLDNWLFINKYWLTGAFDTRDYIFNPMKGVYLSQRFTFVGGILGGSQDYIKTETKAEGFVKLLDVPVSDSWNFKTVLGAHSGISFILPQFGEQNPAISDTDLLYIDGMQAARGWRPSQAGQVLWNNWIELRFPISEQILWTDFFFDAAGLWANPSDLGNMGLDDFYFSFGADLRLTMPNFPIRIGLAKLFRVKDGEIKWEDRDIWKGGLGLQFVISLGTTLF